MDDFLPADYKPPSGDRFEFNDGENRVRILTSPTMGYIAWTDDKKPIRIKQSETFSFSPKDRARFFWYMLVWNYEVEAIQLWDLTQSTIRKAIESLNHNKEWGSPKDYDLIINKEGSGMDTKYQVMPNPKSDLPKGVKEKIEKCTLNYTDIYSDSKSFQANVPDPISVEDVNF